MGFFKKNNEAEHIVGIVLRQNEGVGLLLKTNPQARDVVLADERRFPYSNSWENIVYDIDEVLFNIEEEHKIKIKKVIFFVYAHLVDRKTGLVKSTYLDKIKEIVKQNELESLGYIEYNDVLARYLGEKEQGPLTAIVVEIDTTAISAFIYKSGEVVFSETVSKTENLTADLEEIFVKSNKDTQLPARIIMYDSSDLEKESSQILTHNWPENLFIQLPKVEVMNPDELTEALAYEYKEQLYGANQTTQPKLPPVVVSEAPETEIKVDDSGAEAEDAIDEEADEAEAIEGFVIGKDIAKEVENEPVKEVPASFESKEESVREVTAVAGVSGLTSKFPRFSLPLEFLQSSSGKKKLIGGVLVVVILIGVIFSLFFFLHKAELTVLYQNQEITKTIRINGVKLEKSSNKVTEKTSIATTGKKDIGEKAKGDVTIYNASNEIKFQKGTKFKTADGLVFLLDQDVTADAAEDTGPSIIKSKTKASLTSAEIGPKYNIKNDVRLTIEEKLDSEPFALTTAAFTGGTLKEVRIASKEDYDTIDAAIQKKIKKSSSASIKKASGEKNVIGDLSEVTITDKTYSAEVVEQAESLSLEVSANVIFYSYAEEPLLDGIVEKLRDEIPEKYSLSKDNITYQIISGEKSDKNNSAELTVKATARPVLLVDKSSLVKSVKGKPLKSIKPIIRDEFNAAGYRVAFNSPLPLINSFLPFFTNNITLKVAPLP
ncbi:hypothetical protein A3F34_00530 [Candidatus Roizmanbacteria bacterium RIFCSPHIGHO2_12_FULL_44_10]|uniref:Baseplate protein J-like domain-containing protein n=1 Tax=Candidatus Roizmanbacteria bacterium RIFCSPHIGHO2_12_FULL_44_10 TaxID=1802054 RepID=A0A1F7I613_9BACT|nr:MAG: hypothetical protein A3F34_00530 [Candidatus Roizmanbacteria bacterium RIFCSPHIGHO2_12_FULL_44_10]